MKRKQFKERPIHGETMKVLVTGGTGFLGKRLSKVKPDWIHVSSKEYDLTLPEECKRMFEDHQPAAVVHLAARTETSMGVAGRLPL